LLSKREVAARNRHGIRRILQFETIFDKVELDAEAVKTLADVRALLAKHLTVAKRQSDREYELAVKKLGAVLNATESFLRGDLLPEELAPVRQINIVALCAR
jgi:hypothetical protein